MVELLCALAIFGLLGVILMSAVVSQRQRAMSSTCLSNIRQIGHALALYSQDYDGVYPSVSLSAFNDKGNSDEISDGWGDLFLPYLGNSFLHCPSTEIKVEVIKGMLNCGYAYNSSLNEMTTQAGLTRYSGKGEQQIIEPTLTVAVCEARLGIISIPQPDAPPYIKGNKIFYIRALLAESRKEIPGALRHNGAANYAFLDGHAKWLRPTEFAAKCDGMKPCFKP